MTTINLDEQICPLEKLLTKKTDSTTFKDIISLVFHAVINISRDKENPDHLKWKVLLDEFTTELHRQNKIKWPHMSITKNNFDRRIDVLAVDGTFIKSTNIFMLLLRLLYIENYKRPYIYKSYNYHAILSHRISKKKTLITKLSLFEIFDLIGEYITYYKKIYNDDINIEHNLSKSINNLIV